VEIVSAERVGDRWVISAVGPDSGACPEYRRPSTRRRSRYARHLQDDLPDRALQNGKQEFSPARAAIAARHEEREGSRSQLGFLYRSLHNCRVRPSLACPRPVPPDRASGDPIKRNLGLNVVLERLGRGWAVVSNVIDDCEEVVARRPPPLRNGTGHGASCRSRPELRP